MKNAFLFVFSISLIAISNSANAMRPDASEERVRTACHKAEIKSLQERGRGAPLHIQEGVVAQVLLNHRNPKTTGAIQTAIAATPSQTKAREQARMSAEAEARVQAQARAQAEARAKEIAANDAEIRRLMARNQSLSKK